MIYKYLQGDLFEGFVSSASETSIKSITDKKSKHRLWDFNLDVNHTFRYDSIYEIPKLMPYNGPLPKKLIPYKGISKASHDSCPHFYMSDTTAPLLFSRIEYYTERLRRFDYVIAPDYSMYCCAPLAINLQALFFNRSVAAYWQEHGLNVIPSFNGGDAKTFDYCLAGMPKHSVIATGNVGVLHSPITQRLWVTLVEKAIQELQPTALIIYGTNLQFRHSNDLPVYWHEDFIHKRLRRL